ncbi:MAG: Regulatory sensor-transducer, BlaR1/MecR1 family, partial [Phycisphaerales bacterium]|nr:Regulatory sensor-transducer, BlaR1/MecR1 family [Phycisphaerales bacterium]
APAADSRSVHTIEAGSPVDARSPQSAALSIRTTSPAHAARLPLHSMVDRLSPSLPWLVLAWVSGMLTLSIRNLGAWVAVQHLKSRSTRPVESAIEQAGERLSLRIGLARRVRFLQSALVDSPLVIGVLKPAVLLPASVLTELPIAQLEALLAHELAHVVRHDYLVNLLQSAIETLLFHHPATWWISRRIRIEREFCCDDIAVRVTRDRSTYIRALAAVAGVPAPALAPAASGGLLLPRLRRMLGLPDTRARGASPWLAGALAVVLCMIAAIAPTLYVPAGAAAQQKAGIPDAPHVAENGVTIHGHVFDPDGKPVAGAEVVLRALSTRSKYAAPISVRSAQDGSFTFSGLPHLAETIASDLMIRAGGFGLVSTLAFADEDNEISLPLPTLIRVSFVDPFGKPVAGLGVRPTMIHAAGTIAFTLLEDGVSRSLAQRTDAQGACTFSGMPQNAGLRLAIDDSRFTQLSYKDEFDLAAAPVSPPAIFSLKPGSSISGKILYGPTGKPAAGVRVVAQPIHGEDSRGYGEATTDAEGAYQMTQVAAGVYNVMIVPAGNDHGTREWTAAAREKVHVDVGQNLADVDFTLIKGGLLTGRVVRSDTGLGVADTPVALQGPARPQTSGMVEGVLTGPDGAYTLRVPPGKQYVYLQDTPPDGYDTLHKADVEVADGQTVTADLRLPRRPGKPISGRVIGPDGMPLARVAVWADLKDMWAPHVFQKSDAEGRFHFEALGPGTPLHARRGALETPQPVTVEGGEQDVILRMAPRVNIMASGVVTDSEGKPLANAHVQLFTAKGMGFRGSSRRTLTDAHGQYTIKGLEADGSYHVSAEAAGFGPGQAHVNLKPGEDKSEIGPIRLNAATHRIAGRVTKRDDSPAAGVKVELSGSDTGYQTTRTEADGRFSFKVINGSSGSVFLRAPDGNPMSGRRARAGDEDIDLRADEQ